MRIILIIILLISRVIISAAQEQKRYRFPLVVSHLTKSNKAVLHRKGAPHHNIFNAVVCFKRNCRAYIGWQLTQRSMRYNGFKNVPKLPHQKKPRESISPDQLIVKQKNVVNTDSVIAAPQILEESLSLKQERKFILGDLLFDSNSPALNKDMTYQLDSLIGILLTSDQLKIKITGHTDNKGDEKYNLKLSLDRAQSVANYLVKYGVERNRIKTEGMGSSQSVAPNDTEGGRLKNRRVEILLD